MCAARPVPKQPAGIAPPRSLPGPTPADLQSRQAIIAKPVPQPNGSPSVNHLPESAVPILQWNGTPAPPGSWLGAPVSPQTPPPAPPAAATAGEFPPDADAPRPKHRTRANRAGSTPPLRSAEA